jgi:hypothetical protein
MLGPKKGECRKTEIAVVIRELEIKLNPLSVVNYANLSLEMLPLGPVARIPELL